MPESVLYAKSAKVDIELGVDQAQGVSNFPCVLGFGGRLYDLFCHRFFFVPIHQQLVESFFSKYDTCARKIDFPELDEIRTALPATIWQELVLYAKSGFLLFIVPGIVLSGTGIFVCTYDIWYHLAVI